MNVFRYSIMVNLGLGEPLLHEHIFSIIKTVYKNNKLPYFWTNGTLLGDRMNEILENPPRIIYLSLYDDIMDKQLSLLEQLIQKKPPTLHVGISKLIGKSNIKKMEEVVRIANVLNIDTIWFQQYYPTDDSLYNEQITVKDEECLEYIQELKSKLVSELKHVDTTFPIPINIHRKTYTCAMVKKGFWVEPNGAIMPCCFMPMHGSTKFGNMFKSESDYIENETYMNLKKALLNGLLLPHKKCHRCPGAYY